MTSSIKLATDTLRVYLAANFTVEPIEEFLAFWMSELEIEVDIRVAPYNQVFQQLLEGGLLYSNSGSINLVALDLDSWLVPGPFDLARVQLERTIGDLISTLRVAGSHGAGGAVLLFPAENRTDQSGERSTAVAAAKASIVAACESIAGWTALDVEDAVAVYSVSEIRDPFTKELGDIPFSEEMYAAAATMAARWIRAFCSKPRKVIALDCDNTLWQGVYGEGSMVVSQPYRQLQEFMLRQLDSGMLLVLVSKNNEDDVMTALESENCLLRPEHFAAWQINWSPKSENLKALANDLGLALDSFIFLDDSSYECMEVRNGCPEVLTIQLPTAPESIPGFLEHLWVFDRQTATAEDQARTSMYRAERQRTELSKSTLTVEEFLASLRIEVQFTRATETEQARVAQLTQRTTQFNLTGVLHTEQSLLSTLALGRHDCWTVRVQDVFGDYGLVGVLLFEIQENALRVEEFLLSCRALGRGVEDQMIEKLKDCAVERGANRVVIPVVPTARNRPALEFLSSRCNTPLDSNDPFECSLSILDDTTEWRPVKAPMANKQIKPESTKTRSISTYERDTLLRVALQIQSAGAIVSAVRNRRRLRSEVTSPLVAPRSAVEQYLVGLWSESLGVEPIGIEDNFFELGGTSLIAARILTRVRAEFGIRLNFHSMFETPTVAGLAGQIVNALAMKS
jgi:FkbH-like protein